MANIKTRIYFATLAKTSKLIESIMQERGNQTFVNY